MAFFLNFLHLIFCAVVTAAFSYAFYFDTILFNTGKYKVMGFPFDDSFGRRAKFLTYLDMGLQTVFFAFSTLNAFKRLFSSSRDLLDVLLDRVYSSLAFPFSVIVVGTFWVVYAIDRSLVYPVKLDSIIPVWQNHVMHTLPLMACLINNMFTVHYYQKFLKGVSITILFGLSYLIWVFYIAYVSNKWVYGMLAAMNNIFRGVFVLFQLTTLVLAYRVGQAINSMLWSKQSSQHKQHQKAKKHE